jgi:hypothetical protein
MIYCCHCAGLFVPTSEQPRKSGLKDQVLGRFQGGRLSHRSSDMATMNVGWSQRSTGKLPVDFGFSILIARPRRYCRVDCFLNFAEVVVDTQIK